jgi:tetratricopeptide (TPR) repeat protein
MGHGDALALHSNGVAWTYPERSGDSERVVAFQSGLATTIFSSDGYLSPHGRHAEAIDEMQKAIAIDPFSAPVESFLGRTYIWSRRYDKAMAQFRKCAEMFPGFAIDHERMAQLHAFTSRFDDAIAEDTRARLLSGEDQKSVLQKEAELRRAWTTDGPQGNWKKVLEFTQRPENPPETYGSPLAPQFFMRNSGRRTKLWNASKSRTNNARYL